jgi:hypothetical protein
MMQPRLEEIRREEFGKDPSVWKAQIIAISEVDKSGAVEVVFAILRDDKPVYDNMQTRGAPDEIVKQIEVIGAELRRKVEHVESEEIIKVGQEIAL